MKTPVPAKSSSKPRLQADFPSNSVGDFLKMQLRQLQDKNPNFSLRAFALKLKISPGGLSQILNGHKKLSLDRALSFARLLKFGDRETSYFTQLVQADSISNVNSRIKWLDQISEEFSEFGSVRNLEIDQFRLISEWYGLAILQWVTHFPGRCQVGEIAKAFKLKKSEVSRTIERLCVLEIIEKTGTDSYRVLTDRVEVKSQIPSGVLQNYYRSLIPLIEEKISTQTSQERVIGAEVMAFDETQMEEVRELADQFLLALQKISAKGKKRKTIYQAFFNFFKLSDEKAQQEKI